RDLPSFPTRRSSDMAASLAAFYRKIPVGHVEAGLRTRDNPYPYPEEVNRRITSVIAHPPRAPQIRRRGKRIVLPTAHRRENFGAALEEIFAAVRDLAANFTDVDVVY